MALAGFECHLAILIPRNPAPLVKKKSRISASSRRCGKLDQGLAITAIPSIQPYDEAREYKKMSGVYRKSQRK